MWLLILLFPSVVFAEGLPLQVTVGESYRVPFKVTKAWIQDRDLLRAEEKKEFLYLTPLRKGQTTLKLDERSYSFQAITPEALKYFKSFKKRTPWIGISSDFIGGELTFSGNLHMYAFYQDMIKRALNHKSTFVMATTLNEDLKNKVYAFIKDALKRSSLPDPGIEPSSPLEITLNPLNPRLPEYQTVLGSIGVRVTVRRDAFVSNPIVRTKITILEVQKNISQKWGVLWEGKYSAQIAPSAGFHNDLDIEIQALENEGKAKVLASPNLLCRSGSEAEFLAGGEFPIKISSFGAKDIVWKRFGVFLKVKPLVDSANRIQLSLETEISQVTGLVENLPTMSTNKVSSHFEVGNARTVILSGLIQSSLWKSEQGILGLSDIPILGNLFKSTDFQQKKTELVILVRPEIENLDEGKTPGNDNASLVELQRLQIFGGK